jgi:hypothetical protein
MPQAGDREVRSNPSQAKPSQAKPSQAKPSQAKPSQAKPSQAKPSQAKPSQASAEDRGEESLQLSVGDRLDSIDDPMRLLVETQRRRNRKRCNEQIHQATRTEPDPRHNGQSSIPGGWRHQLAIFRHSR